MQEVDPADLITRFIENVKYVVDQPDVVAAVEGVVEYIHQFLTKIQKMGMGNIISK